MPMVRPRINSQVIAATISSSVAGIRAAISDDTCDFCR